MPRRLSGFAIVILAVGRVALDGQTPEATAPARTEVRALLESAEIKDQTWGAWWVATGRIDEFEPQLRRNLERALDPASQRNRYFNQFVLDATLDALIQVGHNSLPIDLLQSVYAERQEQGVILASQSAAPRDLIDAFMLKVVDDAGSSWIPSTWLAAADWLLIHDAPALVPSVLRGLTFTAHVVLCDPGTTCDPPVVGGYGGSWPSSIPDPSYPPWTHYQVVPVTRAGSMVFIQGKSPATSMSYRRFAGFSEPPAGGPVTTAARLAILAAAAPGVAMPALDGERLTVFWRDDASYRAAMERFRQELVQRYASAIRQLRAANLLTADEATALALPRLNIVTVDRRAPKF